MEAWEGRGCQSPGRSSLKQTNSLRGSLFYSTDPYYFFPYPSFISGREIKKRKCLFGLHARIPPPVESPTGDGAPTRSLVQGGWGNSQGINRGVCMEMGRSLGVSGRGLGG